MERKKSILLTVGIIVTVVTVLATVYILILMGTHIDRWCRATMSLQDPVSLGENVWMVEIERLDVTEGCSRDVESFGVALERNGSAIAWSYQLHNGLVARSDPILIFFADYGKLGRVDAGDLFYLVNLEMESEYDFYVLDPGSSKAGHVTVYT